MIGHSRLAILLICFIKLVCWAQNASIGSLYHLGQDLLVRLVHALRVLSKESAHFIIRCLAGAFFWLIYEILFAHTCDTVNFLFFVNLCIANASFLSRLRATTTSKSILQG